MDPRPAARRATYADLLAAPDHLVAELVDGELHTSPRPGLPHASAASTLGGELLPPFRHGRGGPGGWIILDEPELHLGEQVVVPDLAGWRRTRLPELPDAAWLSTSPDWVCEVLSPATASFDRIRKMPVYAGAAVEWAWLVNPGDRTLEVFRLVARVWTVAGAWEGAARVRAQPFEAIEIDLGLLWER